MGYSFRLAGRVLLYASSHRQDNTYHGLWYTSRWSSGWNEKYLNRSTMKDRSNDPSELHLAPGPYRDSTALLIADENFLLADLLRFWS